MMMVMMLMMMRAWYSILRRKATPSPTLKSNGHAPHTAWLLQAPCSSIDVAISLVVALHLAQASWRVPRSDMLCDVVEAVIRHTALHNNKSARSVMRNVKHVCIRLASSLRPCHSSP